LSRCFLSGERSVETVFSLYRSNKTGVSCLPGLAFAAPFRGGRAVGLRKEPADACM